jgi:hypothetical protein
MAARNKVFLKVRSYLEEEGASPSESFKLAQEATLGRTGFAYFPSGQSKMTKVVKMVDDMCKGVKSICDRYSPFWTMD